MRQKYTQKKYSRAVSPYEKTKDSVAQILRPCNDGLE